MPAAVNTISQSIITEMQVSDRVAPFNTTERVIQDWTR
jgi:hypothetical protein